ncbi:MAG: pilus assembly PilX N-terminal domain-containing protein [Proteobacteria bacterium]|nr:pilus assembly PilX N-terminal domain-containing protein [Pseudomonadota bacterium]
MRQSTSRKFQYQQGAALVVGLLLLLVLTLLAVSGMNSASLEFVMAGNEQYRSNAFQAAEAGIEQTILQGAFNPGSPVQTLTGNPTATDTWTATVTPQLGGIPLAAIWGNSWNSFSTYHFEISSTGTSVRSANAVNLQGIAVISPWDPTVQPDPNLATNLLQ